MNRINTNEGDKKMSDYGKAGRNFEPSCVTKPAAFKHFLFVAPMLPLSNLLVQNLRGFAILLVR
jgi:hypothetical protein